MPIVQHIEYGMSNRRSDWFSSLDLSDGVSANLAHLGEIAHLLTSAETKCFTVYQIAVGTVARA